MLLGLRPNAPEVFLAILRHRPLVARSDVRKLDRGLMKDCWQVLPNNAYANAPNIGMSSLLFAICNSCGWSLEVMGQGRIAHEGNREKFVQKASSA